MRTGLGSIVVIAGRVRTGLGLIVVIAGRVRPGLGLIVIIADRGGSALGVMVVISTRASTPSAWSTRPRRPFADAAFDDEGAGATHRASVRRPRQLQRLVRRAT